MSVNLPQFQTPDDKEKFRKMMFADFLTIDEFKDRHPDKVTDSLLKEQSLLNAGMIEYFEYCYSL